MNELFAPPHDSWRPVSPALAVLRRTLLGIVAGLLLVVVLVLGALAPVPAWLTVLVAVLILAGFAAGWVLVGRNARWWGYAELDEELHIKHGAVFRTLIVVPYGRMQYVDVHAGPLEQAFGVAAVHLHTASPGTSARIPGLPAAEAARLRDRLTSLGEAQAAGL
ncbi:MAG TPA: PH domain-containing protein [Nocardioidaceae bacterium]|nr:PH domain-containing protein [Nocardioidaceae bacterium]